MASVVDAFPVVSPEELSVGSSSPRIEDFPLASGREVEEASVMEFARKRLDSGFLPADVRAAAVGMGANLVAPLVRAAGPLVFQEERMEQSADFLNRFANAYERAAHERNPSMIAGAARGVMQTVPPMVVAGQVAGPLGAIGLAAGQEYDQALTEGKDAGLSGQQLKTYAQAHGIIEGGIAAGFQAIGLGGAETAVSQPVKVGIANALKQAGIRTLQELPEELLTELGHNAARAVAGTDPNALTPKALVDTAAQTTLQTLMTMGVVESPGLAASAFQEEPQSEAGIDSDLKAKLDEIERQYREQQQSPPQPSRAKRLGDKVNQPPPTVTEAAPQPEPQPTIRPMPAMNAPDYTQDVFRRYWEISERQGLTDKIEELAAQRKTAQQTVNELGIKPVGDINDQASWVRPTDLVRAIRSLLGIPSLDERTEFENWISSRQTQPGKEVTSEGQTQTQGGQGREGVLDAPPQPEPQPPVEVEPPAPATGATAPVTPAPGQGSLPPAPPAPQPQRLYQGRGKTPAEIYGQEAVDQGRAVPIFGPGQYYATTREDAAYYGDVTEHDVAVKNPFVLDSDRKWFDLLKAAGTPHLNNMGREFYENPKGIEPDTRKLQEYLKKQGHDGLVVRLDPGSDNTRRLSAMAGHDQLVVFGEQPQPQPPKKKIGQKKGAEATATPPLTPPAPATEPPARQTTPEVEDYYGGDSDVQLRWKPFEVGKFKRGDLVSVDRHDGSRISGVVEMGGSNFVDIRSKGSITREFNTDGIFYSGRRVQRAQQQESPPQPPAEQPPAPTPEPPAAGPTPEELDALAEQMWDEETAPPAEQEPSPSPAAKPEAKKKIGQKKPKAEPPPPPAAEDDSDIGQPIGPHVNRRYKVYKYRDRYEVESLALPQPLRFDTEQEALAESDRLEDESLRTMSWAEWDRTKMNLGGFASGPETDESPAPAPKKSIGKKKTPIADKAAGARTKAAESRKAFLDAVRDSVRNPKITSGVNPDLMRLAVKAAVDTANEGIWNFAEYVETIYNEAPDLIDTLAPYLEAAWRVAKKRDTTGNVSEAGRVADVLPAIQKGGSNENAEGTKPGTGRAGAGRSERPDAEDDGVLEGPSSEDVSGAPAGGDARGSGEGGRNAVHRPDNQGDQPGDAGGRRKPGVRGRAADDAGGRGPDDTGDQPAVSRRANYHLTDPEKIVGGGQKSKFERNKRAIELAQEIPLQNREPTPEELDTLASYVGWGAFGQELFNGSWERPQPKPGWEEESNWLRETLGEEAWRDAQDSIINAHYTDPETVAAMWDMARRLGFTGGRVLEPSMGVGNFFSLMPRDLMEASQLTGIELDQTTASIAKLLHPHANIQIKGYEQSQTPDNFYDLIISNVPFANVKPADRRYERFNASLHNFFFLKAMDQVKPGGLVMFITSNTTMDGKANAARVRRELERHGDLVGAYRFPAGAFQRYAGTKVVADLIILRKRREGDRPMPEAWHNIVTYETPSGGEVDVNEYWLANPDHVFGEINYGRGTTTGRPGMIVDLPGDLAAAVAKAVKQLPEGIVNTEPQTADAAKIQANDTKQRQNTVIVRNGEPLIVRGEHLVPLQEVVKWKQDRWSDKTVRAKAKEIANLTKVREALEKVLAAQRESRDASSLRKALAAAYDSFVADHGYITESSAVRVLIKAGDPLGNALAGLESKNADGTYSKRPIFTRETTRTKNKSSNLSIGDAYAVQRNESIDLNIDRIAELAKTTPEKVVAELSGKDTIYKTANGNWQPADMFLSGNVRRRAREIEAAIGEGITGLEKSLEAIKKVIPPDVPYTDIDANPGATWVPASDYSAFFGHLLNADPSEITVERRTNAWRVPPGPRAFNKPEADTWGHPRVPFNRTLEAALNNESLKVYGKDEKGTPFLDETATREVNDKVGNIREEFRNWIWSSQERVGRLSAAYNETFNAYATPDYDGSHLSFEGLALELGNDPFSFRQHQANAVWRGMVTGKGLYAHEVGTGKTFTMGGLAIESRRLGLASKPMLLAHNANSLGVSRDIQQAYPAAKILYVDNLQPAERDRTIAQIALDDWDLVVLPHSLIDRIELRPETIEAMVRDEIAALDAAAWEAFNEDQSGFAGSMPADLDNVDEDDLKKLKNRTAKELVKERMRLRARIVRAAQLAEDANTVFFEDMGIDMLMVDEAHVFKKLPISSKQQLKGLNKSGSERGTSLMLLANAVRMNNNGRGVHLFTGTPITNTLNEIYNMQRLVMSEEMDRDGIKAWDAWFNTFARSVSDVELTSGGTWDAVERLAAFINIPELRQVIGQYLDTVFADDMPEFAPRENRDGMTDSPKGRPYKAVHNEIGEMTDAQKRVTEDLRKRYTEFKKAKGKEKRAMMFTKTHNPLNIEQEGVKNALDPRFADPTADGDDPRLKVNRMLAKAMVHYYEHPQSTQMIFMQTGFNDYADQTTTLPDGTKVSTRVPTFNLAKDITNKLVAAGVQRSEIAIFSDLSKEKRAEAAEKMRRGEIRFAIGSSETMGTGVNAQDYLVAMHHLDAPWMPGDLEQRNGRGWRQGNKWNTVQEYRYLTEGSHDGRRWQILLTKARFIEAFIRSKNTGRTLEGDATNLDEQGGGGDFAESFSGAAGDPRILIRTKLEKDVEKLERAAKRHASNIQNTLYEVGKAEGELPEGRKFLDNLRADIAQVTANSSDNFRMVVGETTHIDRKDANTAIAKVMELNSKPNAEVKIGSFLGFDMFIKNKYLKLVGKNTYDVNPSVASIESILRNLNTRVEKAEKKVSETETFVRTGREIADRPFPRAADLEQKKVKLAEIRAEITANPDPSPAWLRQGAPTGTSVYYRGQEYDVSGHRGEDTVLLDGPSGIIPADYRELTDQYGTPVFPDEGTDGDDDGGDIQAFAGRLATGGGMGNVRSSPGSPSIPANMTPERGGPSVSAQEIIATMAKLFGVPIRSGRVNLRNALGIYKKLPEIIRTKGQSSGDLAVIAHELGHHLDKTLDIRTNPGVTPTMKRELRALDYDSGKRRLFEGFAEFMRVYLTHDPADVKALAPTFYDYLEKSWLPTHLPEADKIERVRGLITDWRRQGSVARGRASLSKTGFAPGPQLSRSEWFRDKARGLWEKMIQKVFVEAYAWNKADAEVLEKGGLKLGEQPLADTLAVLSRAWPGMANRAIEDGVYTVTGKRIGDSLDAATSEIKEDEIEDFDLFLFARQAEEVHRKRPKINPGLTKEDAEYILAEFRAKYPHFDGAADRVTAYANSLLEVLVDAGAMRRETADQAMALWEKYVPLARARDRERAIRRLGPGTTKAGLIDLASPVKRRHGSGRQVISPLAQLYLNTNQFYKAAVMKHVEQQVVRTFDPEVAAIVARNEAREAGLPEDEQNAAAKAARKRVEGYGRWIEHIPAHLLPTRVGLADVWGEIVKKMEEEGLAEQANLDLDVLKEMGEEFADDWVNVWRPDYTPAPGRFISRIIIPENIMPGGKPRMYEWDRDLYTASRSLAPVQVPWFLKIFSESAKLVKLFATELNPTFAGANPARDFQVNQFQSLYQEGSESTYAPVTELARFIASEVAEKTGGKADPLVKLYKDYGGKLATRYGFDNAGLENMRRKAAGFKRKGNWLDFITVPAQAMREAINVSEVAPRLAEFTAAVRDSGYDRKDGKIIELATGNEVELLPLPVIIKAIRASQVVTMDFGQKGEWAKWADQFIPYLSAGLAGIYSQGRAIGGAARGFGKASRGEELIGAERGWKRMLVASSIMASAAVMYYLARGDDDDYKEQEPWLGWRYWTFTWGGKPLFKVSKSYGYSIIPNAVEAILKSAKEGSAEPLGSALQAEAKAANPIDGPALVTPAIETYFNWDSFREKSIENQHLQRLRPGDRATPYNTELMKAIGQWLNVSPAKMEHFTDTALGGGFRRIYGTAERVAEGKPEAADIPLAGAFVVRKDYAKSIDDFYQEKDRLEQEYNSAKLKGKPPDGLADQFHKFEEYAELMQAIRAPIRDEQDRDKRFEYEKYIVGLSRAALNREPLDRYPNPLKAPLDEMPVEIAVARNKYLKDLAERRNLKPPQRKLGESVAKFRERVEHWQAMRRRSVAN